MTKNELAAQCLIEAAELLSESAGRNGLAKRMADKNLLVPEAKEKIDRLDNAKKDLTGKITKYNKLKSDYEKYEKSAKKANRPMKQEIVDKFSKYSTITSKIQDDYKNLNNNWRDSILKEIDDHTKKSSDIHKKINDRAKSQNEAISDLLSEAIDLLELD